MKITDTDYKELERQAMRVLIHRGLHPYMVQSNRHAWDVFHMVDDRFKNHLYDYLNDNHIETALKRIFKG